MKITIVYRYFWPDTSPYATMLRDMTEWFCLAGHEVEIITAQPAYKPNAGIPSQPKREIVNGIKIRRVNLFKERGIGFLKVVNAALFVISAFFILLCGKKRDLLCTATMPPVLQAFIIMILSKLRGSKFLYHMPVSYTHLTLPTKRIV